jgi:hypothetical protein
MNTSRVARDVCGKVTSFQSEGGSEGEVKVESLTLHPTRPSCFGFEPGVRGMERVNNAIQSKIENMIVLFHNLFGFFV